MYDPVLGVLTGAYVWLDDHAARIYRSINRPTSRKLGAYQQQLGDTVTDTSTYRPLQLSDFKDGQSIRPQVPWGGDCLFGYTVDPACLFSKSGEPRHGVKGLSSHWATSV